jgi:flagellar biosynthesis/type III secretory pathway chaperone
MSEDNWEAEIAGLLTELSATQRELLALLTEKRDLLAVADQPGLLAIQPREAAILTRLQACHDRRGAILEKAATAGRPSDSILSLTSSLAQPARRDLERQVQEASSRSRILQHQSLTNWVVVQRTLLHLSQLLEILATGGRGEPTYGTGGSPRSGGSLVDQAA